MANRILDRQHGFMTKPEKQVCWGLPLWFGQDLDILTRLKQPS